MDNNLKTFIQHYIIGHKCAIGCGCVKIPTKHLQQFYENGGFGVINESDIDKAMSELCNKSIIKDFGIGIYEICINLN